MPQSSVIFFFVFAAFFVFITMRGELPIYMGFLLASPKQAPAPTNADKSSGISWETAAKAIPYIAAL